MIIHRIAPVRSSTLIEVSLKNLPVNSEIKDFTFLAFDCMKMMENHKKSTKPQPNYHEIHHIFTIHLHCEQRKFYK